MIEFTHQFNFTEEESKLLSIAFLSMLLAVPHVTYNEYTYDQLKDVFSGMINQEVVDQIFAKLIIPSLEYDIHD